MSSSTKIDNRKKDILILGKGPTQVLEHTLSEEKMYSINFTVTGKKFCLSLHYKGANSYLFVNGTEFIKFKAKDSETVVLKQVNAVVVATISIIHSQNYVFVML